MAPTAGRRLLAEGVARVERSAIELVGRRGRRGRRLVDFEVHTHFRRRSGWCASLPPDGAPRVHGPWCGVWCLCACDHMRRSSARSLASLVSPRAPPPPPSGPRGPSNRVSTLARGRSPCLPPERLIDGIQAVGGMASHAFVGCRRSRLAVATRTHLMGRPPEVQPKHGPSGGDSGRCSASSAAPPPAPYPRPSPPRGPAGNGSGVPRRLPPHLPPLDEADLQGGGRCVCAREEMCASLSLSLSQTSQGVRLNALQLCYARLLLL